MERDAFLARLARARPGPSLPDVAVLPQSQMELRPGEDPYERFRFELEDVAGTCERVDPGDVPAAVAAAVARTGATRVALAADLGDLAGPVRAALEAAGADVADYGEAAADRAALGALEATVTGCALAVAATGSIATSAATGRAAALVAENHICVVRSEQLVGGLADALRRRPPGSVLAFQSGPSRTADIEKVLILGMHGPRSTHVIVVAAPA
jgi:L-lactate dehydrogenase complex protein LldG